MTEKATTITIQIGNTDGKLTQREWSSYVCAVRREIERMSHEIHFFGGSSNWLDWQNVAWVVIAYNDPVLQSLKSGLQAIRTTFNQDSIAWTVGETEFI